MIDYGTSAAVAAAPAVLDVPKPAMPWLLGFADDRAARNMCFGRSALTLVVSALTDSDQRNRKRRRASR